MRTLFLAALVSAAVTPQEAPPQQAKEYGADVPKTVLELQQFRQSSSIHIRSKEGKDGTATLVNLNPLINSWYLLSLRWNGAPQISYHLENADPRSRRLTLDEKHPAGVVIAEGTSISYCDLLSGDLLDQARSSPSIFYPLCGGRFYLRNPASGHRTTLESVTDFLRDHIWGGEKIIDLGHILLGDQYRNAGELDTNRGAPVSGKTNEAPLPALIGPKYATVALEPGDLGIQRDGSAGGMTPGAWYPANGNPGVYVSIIEPDLIDPAILASYKASAHTLDKIESSALVYLIAFDLDRFNLGFALGTDHPKVGWSDQVLDRMRNPALPGPDGIGTIGPLVATGLIRPDLSPKIVAAFTGGFKRMHGAFRYGELSLQNHGSHYGFIEDGVVLSKIQPGLATIFALDNGSVWMKTWTNADDNLLAHIKSARQNGVPIVEVNEAAKASVPGSLVNRWGPGNWSGSADSKLRTMRGAAALQRNGGKRFLIYSVFSSATPSAMARVFQAYRCEYAMLLDMNALEHTYLAVYRRSGSQLFVDHLLQGMSVLEKSNSGEIVPRFLGYADNRDFFYVMRR